MTSFHANGYHVDTHDQQQQLQINSNMNALDPAFLNSPSAYNAGPMAAQQMQQQMQNGMRNGSPAFNPPAYQTNQVIPSKRPRDEGFGGASPQQAAAMIPGSRAQTPQGSYSYAGSAPSNPTQQAPYGHLQNGASNATPSPVMSNQMRPNMPQRVSTNSPHPFSPTPPQYPAQTSPANSEHGFQPPPNPMAPGNMQQMAAQQHMYAQQGQRPGPSMEQARAMYAMRMQAAKQGGTATAPPQRPPSINSGPTLPNGQAAPTNQPPMLARSNNPDAFLKGLSAFMHSQGKPLDVAPIIDGHKFNIVMLYATVNRFGGYRRVTQSNAWASVCQAMQLPTTSPNSPQYLRGHYERNLLPYEEALQMNMQRQRAGVPGGQQSPTRAAAPQALHQPQTQVPPPMQQQPSPNPMHLKQAAAHAQVSPALNGYPNPQTPQMGMGQGHNRSSLTRSIDATPPPVNGAFSIHSSLLGKHMSGADASPSLAQDPAPREVEVHVDLAEVFDPSAPRSLATTQPGSDEVRAPETTFGGVDVASRVLNAQELLKFKPGVPSVLELGTIDIDAIMLSLQSGIRAEVRLALDTLASLSIEPRVQLELKHCDDLVESLIDVAEEQLDILAENATEVSDDMVITAYEEVVRSCLIENESICSIPEFGSIDYELDRAVDRLICVTTILRNFSFIEPNQPLIASDVVTQFLAEVVRYLGTRHMLLRTHHNTLDFMKDVVIILSNISNVVELKRREQALPLLHFLLAFAPSPPHEDAEAVCFTPFDPLIHRYLPPAVDSLAKLLARDEPNRTQYRAIFAADVVSTPAYHLLTRAMALATSPIPDFAQEAKRGHSALAVEARKPYLMQGLLAAEILSNIAAGLESQLARSWLHSHEGFAQNLAHLVLTACANASAQLAPPRGHAPQKYSEDDSLLRIAVGGIAVLRALAEKSRDPDSTTIAIPSYALPAKETLLDTLGIGHPRLQPVLRQLCAYANLAS